MVSVYMALVQNKTKIKKNFYHFLDKERVERVEAIKSNSGRLKKAEEIFYIECLLRYAIHKKYKWQNHQIELTKDINGKMLVKAPKKVHCSISHSNGTLCCAISDRQIGLDVQYAKEISHEAVKQGVSNSDYYQICINRNCQKEFYRIWTLKESLYKYLGNWEKINKRSYMSYQDHIYVNQKKINIQHSWISEKTVMCLVGEEPLKRIHMEKVPINIINRYFERLDEHEVE